VKPQLHELTSTRFVAAMAVLLGHFANLLDFPVFLQQLISGGIGVSFFFVLSGFILCYRYWDTFAEGVAAGSYRRYFVARVARVYPSYALALVLMTALLLGLDAYRPKTLDFPPNVFASWLATALCVHTFAPTQLTQQFWNAPGWSISTEFGFYLVCPLLLALAARFCRTGPRLALALAFNVAFAVLAQAATLYAVIRWGWDRGFWLDTVASRNIFWRLPEFVTGIVAARLLYGGHLKWLANPLNRNVLLAASLALILAINLAPWPATDRGMMIVRQFRLENAYMLPFAVVITSLAAGATFLSPLLRQRVFLFLGDASYGVYIFHWFPWTALTLAKAAGYPVSIDVVWFVVFITIMFASASYIGFERPARLYLRGRFGQ
jgi:peptidoglycan/LPS O-acetylase OafA/YrhL